jgi:hypothetical protein
MAHGAVDGLMAVSRSPREDRGVSAPKAGATVASRIPTLAVGEVGWGQLLGQHSEVGNSFEAHRRG